MTDDDLITEIERVEGLISDFAEGKRGLHRRRHAVHYTAAVNSIKSLMSGYFKAQGAAVLAWLPSAHIVSVINQFRESATGKRFADSLVPVSLQPLRFPTSGAEDLAFTAAITQLIQGASVTLAQEVSAGEVDAPNIAAQYLRDNSLSKLTGNLSTTTTSRLQDAIADAWDAGGSYDQIVGAIKDTFEDFSEKRAGLIARTEAADAYNEGRAATAQRMGLKQKSWETESGDPCPICIGNEEQGWIGSSELFDSEDAAPTAHPSCFLGGTPVVALGITAAIRRRYEGKICILGIAGLPNLSVTPNHPILTSGGWIAAGLIKPGDDVAQCLSPSGSLPRPIGNPDLDQVEASIEQVFDTFSMSRGMFAARVPVAPEAFHGDVQPDAKVDIVWSASALEDDFEGFHLRPKLEFRSGHGRRVSLHSDSPFTQVGERSLAPSNSFVGGPSAGGVELLAQPPVGNDLGSATTAMGEPEAAKITGDCEPGYAELFREAENAFASQMQFVKVEKIDVVEFSGHVYNLSTVSGMYLANTIVAHNCECVLNFR